MKIKKIISAILAVSVMIGVCQTMTFADVSVHFNGQKADFVNAPYILNDRTMVPMEETLNFAGLSYTNENGNVSIADGNVLLNEASELVKNSDVWYMPLRKVFEGVGKKVDWNNEDKSVSISDYEKTRLLATAEKVKDGKKAAIVFIHDDGYRETLDNIVPMFSKYNINASVAIMGKYVFEREDNPDFFDWWIDMFAKSNGRVNILPHSRDHEYMGESDEPESGVLSNGTEYNYEAGHLSRQIADERARINSIYPNERVLAFIKPGTSYPEGKPQVSDNAFAMVKEHYIAMRNTGGSVDTLPPKDIYSVNSLMATSRNEYEDVENNHTTDYWISEMDKAIDENGLLVYLFHGIEDETKARWNTLAKSRTELLFEAICDRIEAGLIWNGKFDEVMQYTQEYNAITGIEAINNPENSTISVKVTDSISKIDTDLVGTKFEGLDMFDYPVTIKVELPYDWEYAKLTQSYNNRVEIVKPFEESGKRYIYANVVPDQDAAVICEAKDTEYAKNILVDGVEIPDFDSAKYYYKVVRPYSTNSTPKLSCVNENAQISQPVLDENGEGSAFVEVGSARYEIYFCNEKPGKNVLLRIDTSFDDENLTETKKVAEYLNDNGIAVNVTNKDTVDKLNAEGFDAVYCDTAKKDDCGFDFDDTYTEDDTTDYMTDYNQFVIAYRELEKDDVILTVHPQDKTSRLDEKFRDTDILFEIFKDQIKYLQQQNTVFVSVK